MSLSAEQRGSSSPLRYCLIREIRFAKVVTYIYYQLQSNVSHRSEHRNMQICGELFRAGVKPATLRLLCGNFLIDGFHAIVYRLIYKSKFTCSSVVLRT